MATIMDIINKDINDKKHKRYMRSVRVLSAIERRSKRNFSNVVYQMEVEFSRKNRLRAIFRLAAETVAFIAK